MNNVITLANELEKVMKAKEEYQRTNQLEVYMAAVESYRTLALASGVTPEVIEQILYDPELKVRGSYE